MSLRAFVEQFPPLKIALYVNDAICYVFSRFLDLVYFLVRATVRLIYFVIEYSYEPIFRGVSWSCNKLTDTIPPLRRWKEARERQRYERLAEANKIHDEPEPYYEDQPVQRAITYHGALLLAVVMYVFIYFVLIKHHTYVSLSVAFVLMLIYLVLVENSHNLRSILMLCLPIMFTNRGRALVFCSMLALLAGGPIGTMQHNVREIHLSLYCCKQYLIVNTDRYVEENVVSRLVRIEEVVVDLVDNIKAFAEDMREKFDSIIYIAIQTEAYIANTIERLKQALRYCQNHEDEIERNCKISMNNLYSQCETLSMSLGVCKIFGNLKDICETHSRALKSICQLPRHVIEFFRRTIGRKLAEYVDLVAEEFYVDVDVTRSYGYNVTKSKPYNEVISEIQFDVDRKFWYVRVIRRVFNFVSLILVTWIFLTATIYHMHYLRELSYDNMYLDELLDVAAHPRTVDLRPEHEKLYLKPFSLKMNKVEVSKLYVSGLVWLVIVGYISFFVALDFSLYQLVDFLVETLREILFTSDLPLIDLETKTKSTSEMTSVEEKIVRYNRTYLGSLRKRLKQTSLSGQPTLASNLTARNSAGDHFSRVHLVNGTTSLYTTNGTNYATNDNQTWPHKSSIQAFYDRLMASIEQDVPDDVAILESLEACLPKVHMPIYGVYRALFYLALFTFGAVILEAYALRTRHCIANLYYPRRARRRAKWLFRKITNEKPKYDDMHDDNDSEKRPSLFESRKFGRRDDDNNDEKTSRSVLDPDQPEIPRSVRSGLADDDDNELGYGFQSAE